MEPSLGELRQRLIAHVDAESKRRSASKATIASAPLSPRERAQRAANVRFGSKASVLSAEPKSPQQLKEAKTRAGLGRRAAPKGRRQREKLYCSSISWL